MNNLIGVSGKMGAGKDLTIDMLQYLNWEDHVISQGIVSQDWLRPFDADKPVTGILDRVAYKNMKFADTIKDTVCLWLGCSREQLEDRKFKEKPLNKNWWYYSSPSGKMIPYKETYERPLPKCDLVKTTPRLMLQLIGTEGGRDLIHPDIWVNTLMGKYKKGDRWFISDVRFPNEADAIKERGGILLRIERPILEYSKGMNESKFVHPSETGLDNYANFDHTFVNDGTITDLFKKVEVWKNS